MKVELPEVGAPEWAYNDREHVRLDGVVYGISDLDELVSDMKLELARWLRVRQFVAVEREAAKWDCAGERAYLGHCQQLSRFSGMSGINWGNLGPNVRANWIAVAKAVLDE